MNADVHFPIQLSAEVSLPVGGRPGHPRPGAPPQAFASSALKFGDEPEVSLSKAT